MIESNPTSQREMLAALYRDPGPFLTTANPADRRIAVATSLNHPDLYNLLEDMLVRDADAAVRRECAEVLGLSKSGDADLLTKTLNGDTASEVREAAATALGEIAAASSLPDLIAHAINKEEDKLVREACVAALGALGDEQAVPTLIELLETAPPQIRRRCIPALSVFDGGHIEIALRAAAKDRNPMVREAAEMLVGRSVD